jgi:hypothetical protein
MQMQSVAKLCAKSFRHPGIAFYLMKKQGMSSLFSSKANTNHHSPTIINIVQDSLEHNKIYNLEQTK